MTYEEHLFSEDRYEQSLQDEEVEEFFFDHCDEIAELEEQECHILNLY
jgi:hypothetical protein